MREIKADGSGVSFYMPHHGVYRPEKSTTKMRTVFNVSSPSTSWKSLNSIQFNGGLVQEDLFSIMVRFRKHKYAFTTDIEKMFRMINIHPEQTCLQRILWKKGIGEPIKTYELTTVTYGTVNAPYLATRTLKQFAMDEANNFPLAEANNFPDQNLAAYFTEEGIEWNFISPRAPHMGGLWEAGIKSVKYHLKRAQGRSRLTYEEFETVIIQPLVINISDNRLSRWQRTTKVIQVVWKKWSTDYLNTLQQRGKWMIEKDNVMCGTMVIVKEDFTPVCNWLLGRVVEIYHGSDGKPGSERPCGAPRWFDGRAFGHRMMMREHFGQQLHNMLFSVGVEVNNLGGLQTVGNYSKLRHKRNEIREMHSLVFDQVYLKWLVGLHVYEATGFRVSLL
ncbi:integrase catalytic domain-containing protein [Trichonephila clavipes]|nr:integrase catalytic domain-containing protein [Trichonephila clavipes]